MPILAVDQFGRIYETSRDRADGLGYEKYPDCVTEGDVTLGAAYLKSQSRRREDNIKRHRDQQVLDQNEKMIMKQKQNMKDQRRREEMVEAEMLQNPMVQQRLMQRAAMNGCNCKSIPTAISGNALSSNGMSGFNGMSRDQQSIHHAVTGMGRNTAHAVDPMEMKQAKMRAEAQKILMAKARK